MNFGNWPGERVVRKLFSSYSKLLKAQIKPLFHVQNKTKNCQKPRFSNWLCVLQRTLFPPSNLLLPNETKRFLAFTWIEVSCEWASPWPRRCEWEKAEQDAWGRGEQTLRRQSCSSRQSAAGSASRRRRGGCCCRRRSRKKGRWRRRRRAGARHRRRGRDGIGGWWPRGRRLVLRLASCLRTGWRNARAPQPRWSLFWTRGTRTKFDECLNWNREFIKGISRPLTSELWQGTLDYTYEVFKRVPFHDKFEHHFLLAE